MKRRFLAKGALVLFCSIHVLPVLHGSERAEVRRERYRQIEAKAGSQEGSIRDLLSSGEEPGIRDLLADGRDELAIAAGRRVAVLSARDAESSH